jgi:hypothetical protein
MMNSQLHSIPIEAHNDFHGNDTKYDALNYERTVSQHLAEYGFAE